mmetsp:Transcript_22889/g.29893  ORF Transcript_22889/g.29893 Transcript_22889/m.29893 type:complete len:205 (+) Transcript_22889:39-653(+)
MAFQLPVDKDKAKAVSRISFNVMPGSTTEGVEDLGLEYTGNGPGGQFIAGFTASDRLHFAAQRKAELQRESQRQEEERRQVANFRLQSQSMQAGDGPSAAVAPLPEKIEKQQEATEEIKLNIKVKRKSDKLEKHTKKKSKKHKKRKKKGESKKEAEELKGGNPLLNLVVYSSEDEDTVHQVSQRHRIFSESHKDSENGAVSNST